MAHLSKRIANLHMVLFLKDTEIWQWQNKQDDQKNNIVLMSILNKIKSIIKLLKLPLLF